MDDLDPTALPPALHGLQQALAALASAHAPRLQQVQDQLGRLHSQLQWRQQLLLQQLALFQCIDKGVMLFDSRLRIVSANPAARRILGLEHIAGDRAASDDPHWIAFDENGLLLAPDQWPVARTFREGCSLPSTVIGLHHRDGDRLSWLSMTTVPVMQGTHRQPQQVYALFSDITQLKRDTALFARAQALAHIGGWEWHPAKPWLYLTAEAQAILGQQPPTATLQQLLDSLLPASRELLAAQLQRPAPKAFDILLQGQRADGTGFWVRMIGESVTAEPGNQRLAGTLQDVTEHQQAELLLRQQARTDPLTGALNRDALLQALAGHLANGQPCAALYIDLDHFKQINDVLGHDAGDRLLAQASARIAMVSADDGLLGRLGGDEFLVLCPGQDGPGAALRLAGQINLALARPFVLDNEHFTVTASIGIACAPQHGLEATQLVHNADLAMYASKHSGGNGWRLFEADMAQRQQQRLQVEGQLRQAMAEQDFHLVYQPKVDLGDGRIIGAEALLRWPSGDTGGLGPEQLVEHAECTGDIIPLGRWVLQQACQQMRQWLDQGLGLLPVAINVSYRQFAGTALLEQVRQSLQQHGLPGHALELELTERVLIAHDPATGDCLQGLRRLGVRLSIDDFGQGYSALDYLRRLPIQGVKISPLFVGGMLHHRSDLAVCQAIAGIAHSLDLEVVAEGIETAAQREQLQRLGVRIGQGFLFAPGLPADALSDHLRSGRLP